MHHNNFQIGIRRQILLPCWKILSDPGFKEKLYALLNNSKSVKFFQVFFTTFLITSWLSVIKNENTFVPSGGPSFNRILLGFTTINLPAFTKAVHVNIAHEFNQKDFHSLILLFIVAITILYLSYFMFYLALRNLFGPSVGLLGTTLFHITPSVQVVFWSSATFDFFPKVHLTELVLVLASNLYSLKKTEKKDLIIQRFLELRFSYYLVSVFALVAIYIRNSSVSIGVALLILGLVTRKINMKQLLILAFIGITFLGLRAQAMGGFSYKSFSATSVTIPGFGDITHLKTMKKSGIPIDDKMIQDFVANQSYGIDDLVRDKIYFSPPELVIPIQVVSWFKNSLIYHLLGSLNVEFYSSEVLFLTCIIYLFSFICFALRNINMVLIAIMPITLSVLAFGLLSRFSPHQDIQMQLLLAFVLSSMAISISSIRDLVSSRVRVVETKKTVLVYLSFSSILVASTITSLAVKSQELKVVLQSNVLTTKLVPMGVLVDYSKVQSVSSFNAIQIETKTNESPENSYIVLKNNNLTILVPTNQKSEGTIIKLERLREETKRVVRFEFDNSDFLPLEFRLVNVPNTPTSFEKSMVMQDKGDLLIDETSMSDSKSQHIKVLIDLGRSTVCPRELEFLCAVTTLRKIPTLFYSSQEFCVKALNGSLVAVIQKRSENGSLNYFLKFSDSKEWLCNFRSGAVKSSEKVDIYLWQNLLDSPHAEIYFTLLR